MLSATIRIYEEVKQQIKFQIERQAEWDILAEKHEVLFTELEAIGADIVYYALLQVNLIGDKKVLEKAFHILRTHGFEAPSDRPKADDPGWSGVFSRGAQSIRLNFSSTMCQLIQVGTEMKEVPKYKVVCGEVVIPVTPGLPDEIPL